MSTTTDEQAVLEAAQQAFWDLGFEWTGIDVLELRSGVDRTSIQARFGSKRDLLDAALTAYSESFISPRLTRMEAPGAGPADVGEFFIGLATYFEQEAEARRGCLMVNIIAELAQRDDLGDRWGDAFRRRLRDAFWNALAGGGVEGPTGIADVVLPGSLYESRSRWLVAQTLGLWLMVRFDRIAASGAARGVAEEIRRWPAGV